MLKKKSKGPSSPKSIITFVVAGLIAGLYFILPPNISICSFNIQFLGAFKARNHYALAHVVKDYDIVAIQELVAPPYDGTYPDGTTYKADPEAAEFFAHMAMFGFKHVLSCEDTGTSDKYHIASSGTEWFVTFYKPEKVEVAKELPNGFLSSPRNNNEAFERVPHAFSFRTTDGRMDFTLVSVHLQPGDSRKNKARRKQELQSIFTWVEGLTSESHVIVLGDTNLSSKKEWVSHGFEGWQTQNEDFLATNTGNKGKPYDHFLYSNYEVGLMGFFVIDLKDKMEKFWTEKSPYPGEPYHHNVFRINYSDHHPVVTYLPIQETDTD